MDDITNKPVPDPNQPVQGFDSEPSTFAAQPVVSPVEVEPVSQPVVVPIPAILPVKPAQLMQSEQPQSVYSPFDAQSSGPPKKPKKSLIIGAIITAVLVVLIGTGALAYNFWYQNPDRVVVDGIINATKSKTVVFNGIVDVSGGTKVKVEFDGQSKDNTGLTNVKATFDAGGKTITVDGSGLVDKDSNIYLKVKNLKKLVTDIGGTPGSVSSLDAIINKIDNKWLKITTSDIGDYSAGVKEIKKCVDDTYTKFKDDKQAINEVADIFKQNRFIVVNKELPSQNGSLGYEIKIDGDKYQSFSKAFITTKIYKQLHDCDSKTFPDTYAPPAKTDDKSPTPTVVLWINRWGHDITKVTSDLDQDGTKAHFDLSTTFNKTVTVDAPTEFVTIEQLKKDITSLFSAAAEADTNSAN